MINDQAFIYIVGAFIVGFITYNYFFGRKATVKRKLRQTTGKRLSELKNGDVGKLMGDIVYKGKTLIAPLSGRKCVYYYILVERKHNYNNHQSWSVWIEEEKAGDVVIQQDTSYAVVNTELVQSYLITDENYYSGFFSDASESMKNYLRKHGRTDTHLFGLNKTIRYKEGILEEGERVTIVGKANWKTRKEVRLDIHGEKILTIESHLDEPVYLTDDGSIMPE